MNLPDHLTAQGWVFHGEGAWTLTRPGRVALRAQSLFDGKWQIYEDQGDTEGDWRWGEPVRTVDDAGLLAVVGETSREVQQVFDELKEQFGDWMATGVASILVHSKLPDEFGRKEWKDWFFRPAASAFTWARERGLIERRGRSKWAFTPLGGEAARYARFLCDSAGLRRRHRP